MTEPTTSEAPSTDTNPTPVVVPDKAIERAYLWALEHARIRARGGSEVEDELTDAATSAVLWAIERCTNEVTFENFAKAAVRRWVARQLNRIKLKRERRPRADPVDELGVEDLHQRATKPVRPVLIDDLPEDLAFLVRLYTQDAFTLREIGLLTGQSPNTVDIKLKAAALLLWDGIRILPTRPTGQKRLSAG